MCVVTRNPCGNPAASHSLCVSARPVGETSHIATLQASATNWRTSSRPMPLPPPVTTAVLPANSVMCTSLTFPGRSRYGPSPASLPVGKRSVTEMSSRQGPPGLTRELLEEIDSPCLGTSEISTGGGDGSWGGCHLLPSMTLSLTAELGRLLLGSRAVLLGHLGRSSVSSTPTVLPSERSQVKSRVPASDPTSTILSPVCPPDVYRVRSSVTRFQINQ